MGGITSKLVKKSHRLGKFRAEKARKEISKQELERAATPSRNQPDVKDQDMDDSMRMLFGSIHESRVRISPRELQRRKTPEEKEAALQGRLSTGTLRLLYEDLHRNKGANVRSLATKYGVKEEVLQEVLKQYSLPVTPAIN